MTNKELMRNLYTEYDLSPQDIFKHKHYTIITRAGIEKIQAKADIEIDFDVVGCGRDYCIVKARGTLGQKTITTLSSAVQGGKEKREVYGKQKWVDLGSTDSRYIAEIAEKRAMSRIVLKLLGLYAEGYFGEDEDLEQDAIETAEPRVAEIDAITDIEKLREYHKANKGKGKDFDRYILARAEQIKGSSTK